MKIKTVLICPLGAKCEEIKNNEIQRCAWSVELVGNNPSTGEAINDRACAIAWTPILLVENSRQQLRTSAAIESFRNEVVIRNNVLQSTSVLNPLQHPSAPQKPNNATLTLDA